MLEQIGACMRALGSHRVSMASVRCCSLRPPRFSACMHDAMASPVRRTISCSTSGGVPASEGLGVTTHRSRYCLSSSTCMQRTSIKASMLLSKIATTSCKALSRLLKECLYEVRVLCVLSPILCEGIQPPQSEKDWWGEASRHTWEGLKSGDPRGMQECSGGTRTWPRNLSLKLCQSEFWPLPEDVPVCLPLPCMPCCKPSDAAVMLPQVKCINLMLLVHLKTTNYCDIALDKHQVMTKNQASKLLVHFAPKHLRTPYLPIPAPSLPACPALSTTYVFCTPPTWQVWSGFRLQKRVLAGVPVTEQDG